MRRIFLLLTLVLAGCQTQVTTTCDAPLVSIGGICCLDSNANQICDDIEVTEESPAETEIEEEKPKEPERTYLTLAQLEEKINKTYAPRKRYSFEDLERENLTEFEKRYDVRSSDRFNVLALREERHFLKNEANFSNFMQRKYELDKKNYNILAAQNIDYNDLTYYGWEEAMYSYDNDFREIPIKGRKAYLDWHFINYDDGAGESLGVSLDFKISVWCSPEMIVEVWPDEHWGFLYFDHSNSNRLLEDVKELMEEEQPSMVEEAEKISKLCDGEIVESGLKKGEIIFRTDGFFPDELHIQAGESMTIYNENDRWADLLFMLIREKPRKTTMTPIVKLGKSIEYVMQEPGNYTMFNEQFNPRAKIVVE